VKNADECYGKKIQAEDDSLIKSFCNDTLGSALDQRQNGFLYGAGRSIARDLVIGNAQGDEILFFYAMFAIQL